MKVLLENLIRLAQKYAVDTVMRDGDGQVAGMTFIQNDSGKQCCAILNCMSVLAFRTCGLDKNVCDAVRHLSLNFRSAVRAYHRTGFQQDLCKHIQRFASGLAPKEARLSRPMMRPVLAQWVHGDHST